MRRRLCALFNSILVKIGRITIGMRLSRACEPGQIYGYRVSGPSDPTYGLRFDPTKVLLDPYGKAVVVPPSYNRTAATESGR